MFWFKKFLCFSLVLILVIQNCLPSTIVLAETTSEEQSVTEKSSDIFDEQSDITNILSDSSEDSYAISEEKSDNSEKNKNISKDKEEDSTSDESTTKEKNNTDFSEQYQEEQTQQAAKEDTASVEDSTSEDKSRDITKADYSEKKDISAADVQGKAASNKYRAKDVLSDLPKVNDKIARSAANDIFVRSGSQQSKPVVIEGVDRSGDGSNIETITAQWITEDTVENGSDALLYVRPEGDEEHTVVLQINYALSGEHDYNAGDITITIPKNIFSKRDGSEAGSILIPYAEEPSAKNDFNWKLVGDHYILTNTKQMSAATKGYIQFAFQDITPHEVVDMAVSEPFEAIIEVLTHAGNTLGLKSNALTAQFDTEAKVTDVRKYVSGAAQRVSAGAIPESQRVVGEEEYIKIDWYVYGQVKANTDYTLRAEDTMPDEYNGFIINGTSKLEDKKDVYHGHADGRTLYYSYSTAYPASQFQPDTTYTFHNNIKFIVTEDDPEAAVVNPNVNSSDPKLVTEKTASCSTTYSYKLPEWKQPTGHFMVVKNGNDDTANNNITHRNNSTWYDTHLWSILSSGYYGIYPSGLNELQDEYAANGRNGGIRLSYTIDTVGYAMPWMFKEVPGDAMASRKSINYNKPVTITTTDSGISLEREGNKLNTGTDYDYIGVEFPDIPWVYTGVPKNINPDGSWKAVTAGDGTFEYSRDYDKTHIPDILLEIKKDGSWVPYATASWQTGEKVVTGNDGRTVDGGYVELPSGVEDIRTKVVLHNTATDQQANLAIQAAIDYDIRTVVELHSTKKMNTMIDSLFEKTNLPEIMVWNEANLLAEEGNEEIVSIDNDGYDKVCGYTTDVAVYPYKESKQTIKDVDYDNKKVTVHYSARVEERSIINDKKTYEQAVTDKRILPEVHGTWYDLLPKGVYPVLDTVKVRDDDKVTDAYTINNYKGTGRILLVVEADLVNTPEHYRKGDMYYYEDVPRITFDATYSFEDLTDYGRSLHNVIAFESSNPYIGTQEGYSGETDDATSSNNVSTDDAFADDTEKSAMIDLDSKRDDPSFVYAGTTTVLNIISAAITSLSKDVMTNNDGWWSTGLYYNDPEGNKRTVYEGGVYSYRLRMESEINTVSKGLVLYDSLENFYAGSGNDTVDIDAPRWQGTLKNVDVSQLTSQGCKPVIYYSTQEDLQLSDETNPNEADRVNTDLSSSVWVKADEYTGSLADVKAIAVDASKKEDGTDFILNPGKSVVVTVNMRAPSGDDARRYISQKGIWGDSAHAYNNCYLICNSKNVAASGEFSQSFVRKDYTKVGLVENSIAVTKTWNDGNDRDGKRPETVTLHLYANGEDTGNTLALRSNDTNVWTGKFENIPYTDPEGNVIRYSIREEEVPGYSTSITPGNQSFKIVNTHKPEKINISGEKTWEGDLAENRPESIIVSLYADGELIGSTNVVPNDEGKWTYSFRDVYKYKDGNEITYTVKEKSSDAKLDSYLPQVTGYDIKNIYHPYGDLLVTKVLKDATDAAKAKDFTFTITFEKDNAPVFDEFDYDILENDQVVSSGKISSNDTFVLKGGQSLKVKEIQEGVHYNITEAELKGFKQTKAENTDGTIKPNKTVTAAFENTYVANGNLSIAVTKKLTNSKIRKYAYFFDLYQVEEGKDDKYLKYTYTDKANDIHTRPDGTLEYSTAPAVFGNLTYTNKDVGKTYTYKIVEQPREDITYIDYDDTEYFVDVTITDPNGDGDLLVTPVYRKGNEVVQPEDVVFTNDYHASGQTQLKAWKTLNGRDLKTGEFTFDLYDENGEVLQTKLNGVLVAGRKKVRKISRTENINDDGEKNGDYVSNKNYTDVVTIPGAEQLHVTLKYTNPRGNFWIWEGSHPEVHTQTYASEFNPNTVLKKYNYQNGKDQEFLTDGFTVDGDSVTMLYSSYAYSSDAGNYSDMVNYGYYAVIEAETGTDILNDDISEIKFDQFNFTETDIGKTLYYTVKEVIPDNAVPYKKEDGWYKKVDSQLTYGTATDDQKKEYLWGDPDYDKWSKTGGVIYDNNEQRYQIKVKDNQDGTLSFDQNMVFKESKTWELYRVENKTETAVTDDQTHQTKRITSGPNALPQLSEELGLANGTYRLKEVVSDETVQIPHVIEYKVTNGESYTAEITDGTLPVFENNLEDGRLKISKSIINGDPNKKFKFKVKLFGNNNEKLNGTYQYKSDESKIVYIDRLKWQSALKNVANNMTGLTLLPQSDKDISKSEVLQKSNVQKVDDESTNRSIYIYREYDKVYYWSDAETIYCPEDSANLFYERSEYKKFDLNRLNTSNVINASSMFKGCRGLEELDVSHFDVSNMRDMSCMFYAIGNGNKPCVLKASNWNAKNAENISSFASFGYVSTIDFSNLKLPKIVNFNSAFSGIYELNELNLSNLYAPNVENTSYMFQNTGPINSDDKLISIDLSGANLSKVKDGSYMFINCNKLKKVDLTGINMSSLENAYEMFYNCHKLEEVDISSINTSNVTNMSYMFEWCENLEEIDLSNNDMSNVENAESMFRGCTKLQELDLSNKDLSKLKKSSYLFDSSNVSSVDLSNSTISFERYTFKSLSPVTVNMSNAVLTKDFQGFQYDTSVYKIDLSNATLLAEQCYAMFCNCSKLEELDMSNVKCPNAISMESCFYSDRTLKKIDLTGIETPVVEDVHSMFSYCYNLKDIIGLNDLDTGNVTNMSSMFNSCSGLTSLDVSNFDTGNVTNMSSMFHNCPGLTSLDVSGFNTGNVTDMSSMFENCSKLKNLDVSSFNTEKVTTMSGMFENCSKLTGLDVSSFNTGNVTSMYNMFGNCSGLTSLDVSSFNTGKVTNMSAMFSGCNKLEQILVSDLWNLDNVTSSSDMFRGCSSLPNFDSNVTDKTKAHYNTGGYLTYKASPSASTNRLSAKKENRLKKPYSMIKKRLIALNPLIPVTVHAATGDEYTITYNANGGYFDEPGTTTNLMTTRNIEKTVVKYSHTPNIGDDGTKSGDYANSLNINDVITIDGASKLEITITYSGESQSWDWACIWAGNYPTYTAASNYSSALSSSLLTSNKQKLGGSPRRTETFIVNGDTATIGFRSDGSGVGDGYGYYAVVKGMDSNGNYMNSIEKTTDGEYKIPENPEPQKTFTGWYTDAACTQSADPDEINSTVTLYAKYDVDTNNIFKITTDTASNNKPLYSVWDPNFNKITFFQDDNLTGSFTDKTVSDVIQGHKSNVEQIDFTTLNDAKIILNVNSGSNKYFYNCSNLISINGLEIINTSNMISMNSMFCKCSKLTSLDISSFNTGNVTNMGCMFSDCSKLTSLDVSSFNTEKVTTMSGMFENCSKLTGLDVSSFYTGNVTSMYNMFGNCSGLTSLDVSSFNTEKVTSMESMFYGCSGLTSLNVSSFNTGNVTDMYSMFQSCSGLTSLDVSSFNTGNVTNMSYMFFGCSKLTGLDVSSFNTGNVTNMSRMFKGCSKLTSLDVSSFNTSKVTNMVSMFSSCSGLTSLDVSSFDTRNVTNMSQMFYGCSGLTSIDLNSFNTEKVTGTSSMFESCSGLTSLDVSSFNTGNVTNMSYMFNRCSKLTSLDVSSFSTEKVTDMGSMFSGCSKLTSLDVSSFNTEKTNYMNSMFSNNNSLRSITLGPNFSFKGNNIASTSDQAILPTANWIRESTNDVYTAAQLRDNYDGATMADTYLRETEMFAEFDSSNGQLRIFRDLKGKYTDGQTSGTKTYYSGLETITGETNPKWYDKRSSIRNVIIEDTFKPKTAYKLFYGCRYLENIIGIDKLDTFKVTNMSYMFSGCSGLSSLDVSSFNTGDVTSMYYMFYNCSGLTSLDVSSFNTGKVTNMGSMFNSCSGLSSLDVSSFNTGKVTNMGSMFYNCSGLTSLDVSSFDTENVTSMYNMFNSCSKLTSLDVSRFNTEKVTNMSYIFYNCSGLTSLDVSNFDTGNVTSMSVMFAGCSGLTSLDVSSFNTENVTTMSSMFNNCSGLTSLDISSFNTEKVINMYSMFNGDSKLESIKLGSDFDFKGNNITSTSGQAILPTPPASEENNYTGRWIKANSTLKGQSPEDLRDNYGDNANEWNGTWVWEEMEYGYSITYQGDHVSGSMSKDFFDARYDNTIPTCSLFRPGYNFDHWEDDNGNVYSNGDTIPANRYSPKQNVTFNAVFVQKTGDVEIADGEFEISLQANESFVLDLPAGTKYQVFEETESGWTLVSQTNDSGEIEPLEGTEAVFLNKYEPDKTFAQFTGQKTLDGELVDEDNYSFVLKEGSNEIERVFVRDAGMVQFSPIVYTSAGNHTYTIEEVNPQDPNIIYDTHTETVHVNVTDDGNGNLSSEVVYDNDGILFENQTRKRDLMIEKTGHHVTNANKDDQFTFDVVINGEHQEVSCKVNGSVTIPDVPSGTEYSIEEINIPDGWSLTSASNEEGMISPTEDNIAVFDNTYAASGSLPLVAYKKMDHGIAEDGQFTFQLFDHNDQLLDEKTNGTAQADGKAPVNFEPLNYTTDDIGQTYTYHIREKEGNDDSINYDNTSYDVNVSIEDAGGGKLNITVPEEREILFDNSHKPASLKVAKHITSAPDEKKNDTFDFTININGSHTGKIYTKENILKHTVDITDTGNFTLGDDEYLMIENIPDGTEYSITESEANNWILDSSSNASGTLLAGESKEAVFNNKYADEYKAVGELHIKARKVQKGGTIEDSDNLQFQLMDEEGNVLQTKGVDQTGGTSSFITFDGLHFTEEDAGKTLTYFIKEVAGDDPYMHYDTKEHEVQVAVTDNGDGTLAFVQETVTYDNDDQKRLSNDIPTIINEKTGSLKIQKNATSANGSPISPNTKFNFTVSLDDPLHTGNEKIIYNDENFTDNVAHVTIGPNESLTLDHIPAGMTYTIVEEDKAGYTLDSSENGTGTITVGETKTAVFNNIYTVENCTLTVTKNVTGNMGNKTDEFHFTARFTGDELPDDLSYIKTVNGVSITGTYDITKDTTFDFTLSHGDSIVFNNLPVGAGYAISENDGVSQGYQASVENNNNSGTLSGNTTVTFVNRKNLAVPTNGRVQGMYALLLIAILGFGIFLLKKKKRIY